MRFAPSLLAVLLCAGAQAAETAARPSAAEVRAATQKRSAEIRHRDASRPRAKPAEPAPVVTFTPEEVAKLAHIASLARDRYPKRRDTPLRTLNISDYEVRELQQIATNIRMPEIVNISPVVTGCPCEEGADCTEQVYVIGRFQDRHIGLQFSRQKNRWSIGRVQRWWLDYAALLAREKVMEKGLYEQAHARMLLEFPACPSGTTLERATAAADTPSSIGNR